MRSRGAGSTLSREGHHVTSADNRAAALPDFRGFYSPTEVAVPQPLVHPDKTAAPLPEFRCTLRDSGLDVAWVRLTGELDIATAPQS